MPIKLVIVGCGCQGLGFADFIARHRNLAELVGIAFGRYRALQQRRPGTGGA